MLDRSARGLRVLHEAHDLREYTAGAHGRGPYQQRPGAVHRRADHPIARALFDRQRLAGEHRFVERRAAVFDDAVHGHAFTGTHDHAVAHHDLGQRTVDIAVAGPHAGHRGLQRDQPAQGARRLVLRARLQGAAEQHERDDEEDGLVVDVGGHSGPREQIRRGRRDQRIEERGAGAEGHQRVHVGGAMRQVLPRAYVERTPRPRHQRRGHDGLAPGDGRRRHGVEPRGQPLHRRAQATHHPRHEGIGGDEVAGVFASGRHQRHADDHRGQPGRQGDAGFEPDRGIRRLVERRPCRRHPERVVRRRGLGLVADVAHGAQQAVELDDGRVVGDRRRVQHEVDARLADAVRVGEAALDRRLAGGAGHALHGKRDTGYGHVAIS